MIRIDGRLDVCISDAIDDGTEHNFALPASLDGHNNAINPHMKLNHPVLDLYLHIDGPLIQRIAHNTPLSLLLGHESLHLILHSHPHPRLHTIDALTELEHNVREVTSELAPKTELVVSIFSGKKGEIVNGIMVSNLERVCGVRRE